MKKIKLSHTNKFIILYFSTEFQCHPQFQAAEAGDLESFVRLYQGDNARLGVKDARGRSAVHLAAAKNRVNILQYICSQQGSKYTRNKQLTKFADCIRLTTLANKNRNESHARIGYLLELGVKHFADNIFHLRIKQIASA